MMKRTQHTGIERQSELLQTEQNAQAQIQTEQKNGIELPSLSSPIGETGGLPAKAKKHLPQKLIVATASVLVCALVLSAFTLGGTKTEETETVYKESAVSRGDLTVGVTESGSASVQAVPVACFEDGDDVTVKIEEVLVKAGQQVQEGDVIARVSVQDIDEQLEDLQLEYQKAVLSLEKTQIEKQKNEVSAASSLKSSLTKGETAEAQYEVTLKEIENEIRSSKLSLSQIEDNINDYKDKLAGELEREYKLESLSDAVYDAEDDLSDWENEASQMLFADPVDESARQSLVDAVNKAQKAVDSFQEQMQNDADQSTDSDSSGDTDSGDSDGEDDSQTTETDENAANVAHLQELEDKLSAAQAALDAYDAAVSTSGSGYASSYTSEEAEQKTAELEKALEQAQDAYDSAFEKYKTAYKEAQTKLESLLYDYESQQLKVETAETNQSLKEAEAEIEKEESLANQATAETVYEFELKELENSLNSEQLAIQEVQEKIADLQRYQNAGEVTAPCSGLIMSVNYSEGDKLKGSDAIATVANSENVTVSVSIAQDDIADITLGKQANVQFSAYDQKFTGVVDSITIVPARTNASTVSYTVAVKLDGDTTEIYEGMTGDVTFITKEIKDVLYVTNKAVTTENGISTVKVKNADGTIAPVTVETGFSDGRNVEVTSGLEENQTVLIESKVASK